MVALNQFLKATFFFLQKIHSLDASLVQLRFAVKKIIAVTDPTLVKDLLLDWEQYQKGLPPVTLWAIKVEEPNPPKGIKPVKWILLSSKEITNTSIAKTIVRYYELRWLIERFHYVLKVGAGVTDLQLETPQRILKAVAA